MWNPFRVRRDERAAERAHQAHLLETFLHSLQASQESAAAQSKSDSEALIAVAKGMTAQATAFSEWIKCFQVTTPPTSTRITEEQEYEAEQLQNLREGKPVDFDGLPAELQLAYALQHDPNLLGSNEPMTP